MMRSQKLPEILKHAQADETLHVSYVNELTDEYDKVRFWLSHLGILSYENFMVGIFQIGHNDFSDDFMRCLKELIS